MAMKIDLNDTQLSPTQLASAFRVLAEAAEGCTTTEDFRLLLATAGCPKLPKPHPGIRWSDDYDDAMCDLDNYGGYLLREGGRFVVCESDDLARRFRTQEQIDALEATDYQEPAAPGAHTGVCAPYIAQVTCPVCLERLLHIVGAPRAGAKQCSLAGCTTMFVPRDPDAEVFCSPAHATEAGW